MLGTLGHPSLPALSQRPPDPQEDDCMSPRQTLRHLVIADVRAQADGRRSRALFELLTVKGIAGLLYRLAHAAGELHPLLGLVVKQLNHVLTGADIAWQARIGPGLILYHPTGVVIG